MNDFYNSPTDLGFGKFGFGGGFGPSATPVYQATASYVKSSAFVVSNVQSAAINLSSMFSVPTGSSAPAYIVLTGLDRNEYSAGATGATGALSGNGATDTFSSIGSDGRGVDIVFTYNATTGQYTNSAYGNLSQITYNASASPNDITSLSLFGTNSLSIANSYGNSAYSMVQHDASGYLGSVTIATQSGFQGSVPAQATPSSIAAVAESFVGKAWNMNGCWTLASTIAAEAGAGLSVTSTMTGAVGQANGEWIVAYNGPAGQSGNWQSMVTAGEVILFGTTSGSVAHITTCVSGSGSTAMLVDNITYENAQGQITNLANDGSSSDVTIASPHAASQEWAGIPSNMVVIYELDAPIVTALVAKDTLLLNASQTLSKLFSATDPASKAITEYQVYDTATTDSLAVGTTTESAHTAANAVTTASLSSVALVAGSSTSTDTIEVRAYNGSYWGDWQSLAVNVSATASPPVVANQTSSQTWTQGHNISLVLAANTFSDPNGETLAYTATQSNGQALPNWLTFNAATDSFSGVAPSTAQSLSLTVTATDTSGLSVSETFSASVVAQPGITLAQTAAQTWMAGQTVSFALPTNTFTDNGGTLVSTTAYQTSGRSVTSWLNYNSTTETFSGTVPSTASGTVTLEVVARDSNGYTAADVFLVNFANGTATTHLVGVASVSAVTGMELLHA